MGCYVNPPKQDKVNWLLDNCVGKPSIVADYKDGETAMVCLVDNGMFTAAGVAFDKREFDAFNVFDGREKFWFEVPRAKLYEVSDLKSYE